MENKPFYKSHLFTFFVGLASFLLGIYYTSTYWWDSGFDKSFINLAISFYCFVLPVILFSHLLAYVLVVPKNIKFNLSALTYNNSYNKFKNEVGDSKVKKVKIISGTSFCLLFILSGFGIPAAFHGYEKQQLSKFGIIQKVEILDITKSTKGINIAIVQYNYKSQDYSKELYLNKYKIGEKANIIFSKKNPNIAVWENDFISNK